jgi:hypothetical protein
MSIFRSFFNDRNKPLNPKNPYIKPWKEEFFVPMDPNSPYIDKKFRGYTDINTLLGIDENGNIVQLNLPCDDGYEVSPEEI